jgi:hypothetical protein
VDLREIAWEFVDWIRLPQDRGFSFHKRQLWSALSDDRTVLSACVSARILICFPKTKNLKYVHQDT